MVAQRKTKTTAKKATRKTAAKKTTRKTTSRKTSTRKISSNRKDKSKVTGLVSDQVAQAMQQPQAKSKRNKSIVIVVLVILALYLLRGVFVVALVNGTPIYRYSVVKRLESIGGTQVVSELIQQELVLQESRKRGIEVTQDELNQEISTIEEQLAVTPDGPSLDDLLSQQNVSRSQFEESLTMQISMKKLIEGDINLSDEQVADYFEANSTFFEEEELTDELKDQIREILTQTELSTRGSTFLQEIQNSASITTFVDYAAVDPAPPLAQ